MHLNDYASALARGFDLDRWWKMYEKAQKNSGVRKSYYIFRYMRAASKDGGYCGRTAVIKGKPVMPHGFHGVHISIEAVIGANATIFQNVTITNVTIGDDIFIGAGAVLVGPISIGNHVKIGAGTVVVDDIPDNCTVVGQKAKIIQNKNTLPNGNR